MSEENSANALNELKEAAEEMIKLSKRLCRESKRGVDLSDYDTFQDTYLELNKLKSVVKAKLMNGEDSLSEDVGSGNFKS